MLSTSYLEKGSTVPLRSVLAKPHAGWGEDSQDSRTRLWECNEQKKEGASVAVRLGVVNVVLNTEEIKNKNDIRRQSFDSRRVAVQIGFTNEPTVLAKMCHAEKFDYRSNSPKGAVIRATKSFNSSSNIVALQVLEQMLLVLPPCAQQISLMQRVERASTSCNKVAQQNLGW